MLDYHLKITFHLAEDQSTMATLRLLGLLGLRLVIFCGQRQKALKCLVLLLLTLLLWLVFSSMFIVVLLDNLTLPQEVNQSQHFSRLGYKILPKGPVQHLCIFTIEMVNDKLWMVANSPVKG